MKTIVVIQADLEVTPLGTKSRLTEELGGVTIIRRTADRVSRMKRLSALHVLCPSGQVKRCESLLRGSDAVVHPYDAAPPPWASLVQPARKWSLDGWRGGIGGTSHFDEYVDARLIAGLFQSEKADAVLCVPAAAPLIDPDLADRMIESHCEADDDIRVTFCQAPPGVAGIVLTASLVMELAEKGIPLGWIFSYKPDSPQKDMIFQPCCYNVPAELRHAVGRLATDTLRSTQRVAALLSAHDEPDLVRIGSWLTQREQTIVEPLPREVEIELTTDDPYPESVVRPRGSHTVSRGPIDIAVVERVVEELIRYDDALVVLGGIGDPLLHPQFSQILRAIRSVQRDGHGLYGLAVRTTGVHLTDEIIDALVAQGVDVLNVTLDAWTPELYSQLHTPGNPAGADFGGVCRRLDRLSEVRQSGGSARPIVVPEMTKMRDNVQELDDFHDGWLRRVGAVAITGYSDYAGQCDDLSVINMAPAPRLACRRLGSRCLVLADGRVTTCDQDFKGVQTVGCVQEQSLEAIWHGEAFECIRRSHRETDLESTALCAACQEWHRP